MKNGRIKRRLNSHTRTLLVEWLKSLLSEEDAKEVTPENYRKALPKDTHFILNRRKRLCAFTERWTRKQLKKLMRYYPQRPLESFTIEDVKEVSK